MTHPIPLRSLPRLANLSRASGWLAALGVGLAIGLPSSAAAEPQGDAEARPRPAWARWLDPNAERPPAWLGENVYYKKGAGLEYRREAKFGGSPIEIGFQGPVLRKKKEASGFSAPGRQPRRMSGVGVIVEVRF